MQKEWGAHGYSRGPCTQHHCIYAITLNDLFLWWSDKHYDPQKGSALFTDVRLFKTYALFGGHPTRVFANLRVHENRMWGADFGFEVFTYPGTGRNDGQVYAVGAGIGSGTRLTRRHESARSDLLREGFRTTEDLQCLGCQDADAEITQQTDPKDIERLNRLDLSCITRWLSCKHPDEMAPELWKQAMQDKPMEDRRQDDDRQVCTVSPSILARESNDIALVKVLSLETMHIEDSNEQGQQATVQILKLLKNGRTYRTNNTPEFAIPPRSIRPENGDKTAALLEGKEYLFLYREPRPDEIDNSFYLEPCHGLLATPENTALIQQGIALDPSAGEPYEYWREPYTP
jgi:hypothetical protein